MSNHDELIERLRASAAAMPFDAAVAVQYRAAADALEAQAREIEGLRKQDDALILQLVEALESARVWKCKEIHHMMREAQYTPAIQAGRARLGEKT